MNNEWKMDKIYQYGWKIVEMGENMIDKCINPQYWWTHSICCIQYSLNYQSTQKFKKKKEKEEKI